MQNKQFLSSSPRFKFVGIKMEQNESCILGEYLEADGAGYFRDFLDGSQSVQEDPQQGTYLMSTT